jgi:hypothetical protein
MFFFAQDEARRYNLAELCRQRGGQAAVARALGRDRNQIWQWLLPMTDPRSRNMSTSSARRIEEAFNLPPGWMDQLPKDLDGHRSDHEDEADGDLVFAARVTPNRDQPGDIGQLSPEDVQALSMPPKNGDLILLKQHDAWGSMGEGGGLQEHLDVVRAMRVSLSELRRQIRGPITSPENLSILPAYGTSMRPTFEDGDPLLVDTGVSEVDREGVYVLERDSKLYVKRMQRRISDGSLLMISDNRDEYPIPESIQRESINRDFFVRGRVLMVWNARKL